MKTPTALQVKAAWVEHPNPSARAVAATLVAAGYSISYKTVGRYKKAHWAEPNAEAPKKKIAKAGKALAKVKKQIAESGQEVPPELGRKLERMQELYTRSVAENQATLQQAGLIAGIIIAEETIASIEMLTRLAPGDVARLLHAITEATQVKHVGGAGQTPEKDDPNVIDVTPVRSGISEAIDRFRKNAGLD